MTEHRIDCVLVVSEGDDETPAGILIESDVALRHDDIRSEAIELAERKGRWA